MLDRHGKSLLDREGGCCACATVDKLSTNLPGLLIGRAGEYVCFSAGRIRTFLKTRGEMRCRYARPVKEIVTITLVVRSSSWCPRTLVGRPEICSGADLGNLTKPQYQVSVRDAFAVSKTETRHMSSQLDVAPQNAVRV
jgi:hypothetical protein